MKLDVHTDDDVRRLAREVLAEARPAFVSQRTVMAVVGVPPRDYMRLAREGAFPVVKEKRIVLAKTADVVALFEGRLTKRAAPANDADELDAALARVGGRRA